MNLLIFELLLPVIQFYYYLLEDVELGGATSQLDAVQVEANRGGQGELIVAILMAVVGIIGLGMLANKGKMSASSQATN